MFDITSFEHVELDLVALTLIAEYHQAKDQRDIYLKLYEDMIDCEIQDDVDRIYEMVERENEHIRKIRKRLNDLYFNVSYECLMNSRTFIIYVYNKSVKHGKLAEKATEMCKSNIFARSGRRMRLGRDIPGIEDRDPVVKTIRVEGSFWKGCADYALEYNEKICSVCKELRRLYFSVGYFPEDVKGDDQ